jgi:probable phosphoglycerate mutase
MPRRSTRPRPTVVLFVRHGKTATTGKVLPGQAPGLHLDDTGQAQAKAVAERVASSGRVDAIYASHLERAAETAEAIAAATGLAVQTEPGLADIDTGQWTGRELKEARRAPEWKVVQSHPSGFRFPGGESFPELVARVADAVDRLRAAHPGGTVVAVSHADPIKVAAATALGTPLDLFQRIVVSPCSVTTIAYPVDGPPAVLGLNWSAEPAGGPRPGTR